LANWTPEAGKLDSRGWQIGLQKLADRTPEAVVSYAGMTVTGNMAVALEVLGYLLFWKNPAVFPVMAPY
jgi:hypothetical protein